MLTLMTVKHSLSLSLSLSLSYSVLSVDVTLYGIEVYNSIFIS